MAHSIKNHSKVFGKAQSHEVTPLGGNRYLVISGESGEEYEVSLGILSCTCPRQDFIGATRNGNANMCSHVQAATLLLLEQEGYALTPRTGEEDLSNLHRRVIDSGAGDNVWFTARKDMNPRRRLRKEIVDDRPSGLRGLSVEETNEVLFGV